MKLFSVSVVQLKKEVWLKATVVGSLWASMEIILGSFFHNLRIPLAGTWLTMISIVFIVAFLQIWKDKGILWRAGLICALMKSVSPSAILIGPMIGIFSEAILMDASTRLFGRNFIAYAIGGSLAMLSTLMHKIVTLIIYYGFDIVKLIKNLYEFSVKQLGNPELKPEKALIVLLIIYILLGVISVLLGYIIGRKSTRNIGIKSTSAKIEMSNDKHLFKLDENQQFSVKVLFLHLLVLGSALLLLNNYPLELSLLFIVPYILISFIHYKRSLNHLKKPQFWIYFILITLFASLFFNGFNSDKLLNTEGLIVGLKMNIRAILVLVGFSGISVELRNPLIKTVLQKRGFTQLYQSLGLAFSVLPSIIDQFAKPKLFLRMPFQTMSEIFIRAKELYDTFERKVKNPNIIILTGNKHSGKTTFALNLANQLKSDGEKVGGFLAPGKFEHNQRKEFDILDLNSGTIMKLCDIHQPEGEKIGPFRFNPEGQNFGKNLLQPENLKNSEIIFIDEIGPLELKGLGWAESINGLMNDPDKIHLWVVRRGIIKKVIQKWSLINTRVIDTRTNSIEQVLALIKLMKSN